MDFCGSPESSTLRSDQIVNWFETTWIPKHPESSWFNVRTYPECFKRATVLEKLLNGQAFNGFQLSHIETLDCEIAVSSVTLEPTGAIDDAYGAYIYHFVSLDQSRTVKVAAICVPFSDDGYKFVAFACVPEFFTGVWFAFATQCYRLAYAYDDQDRVIVIGGRHSSFVPTTKWDDIVLPALLKTDIMEDVQSFFEIGVGIYTDLNLKPFRKLLLAGVPGTGKTLLCNALAKWALDQHYLVIYVSSMQKNPGEETGATFSKIEYALEVAQNSERRTLIIVEELDAYLHEREKAIILNVLDGSESAFNPHGTLLIATTNYPEAIDERVLKRPGRLDRIFIIPEVKSLTEADKMLRHYLGKMWQEDHTAMIERLIGYPGAFIREVAIYALTQVAYTRATTLSVQVLEDSFESLKSQIALRDSFLKSRAMEQELIPESVVQASLN